MDVVQAQAALDAENAVLGSMLIDADTVAPVLGIVKPEDFFGAAQRTTFETIRALFRESKPIDAITVCDRAGWSKDGDKRVFLAELMEITPTSTNAAEYAEIVHEQALLRALRERAEAMALAPTLDDCRAAVASMTEILSRGTHVEARSLRDLLLDFSAAQISDTATEYIQLGFDALDRNVFVERGDFVMIGGAPSDGKTALALQIGYNISARRSVGFYSLETGYKKLRDRIAAQAYGISFGRIKRRALTGDDWDKVAADAGAAERRRMMFEPAAGMTADQIMSSAKARGYDVIVVDYGQLVTPAQTRGLTRAEQMAEVSRTFHLGAQTSGIVVILLLQLTRLERGTKRDRDMFDLGESSQFERDADLILLIERPKDDVEYSFGGVEYGILDANQNRIVRIAKQKEGCRAPVPMHFDGDLQRFAVLEPDGRVVLRKLVEQGKRAKQRNRGKPIEGQEEMPF